MKPKNPHPDHPEKWAATWEYVVNPQGLLSTLQELAQDKEIPWLLDGVIEDFVAFAQHPDSRLMKILYELSVSQNRKVEDHVPVACKNWRLWYSNLKPTRSQDPSEKCEAILQDTLLMLVWEVKRAFQIYVFPPSLRPQVDSGRLRSPQHLGRNRRKEIDDLVSGFNISTAQSFPTLQPSYQDVEEKVIDDLRRFRDQTLFLKIPHICRSCDLYASRINRKYEELLGTLKLISIMGLAIVDENELRGWFRRRNEIWEPLLK